MSKRENWVWMPHPGHFIASYNCHFILNTYVGGYIVSTVGEYVSESAKSRGDYDTLGGDRLYETMVFKARREADPEWQCCPWQAIVTGGELDFAGYTDGVEAYKGHLKLCKKWATPPPKQKPTKGDKDG